MRLPLVATSLALVLFAACGGDGGGSAGDDGTGDDGGGTDAGQDTFVPPQANCAPLDLTQAPEITIVNGTVTPNPQAGAVSAHIYKLTAAKLETPVAVTGTVKSRVEIVPGNATIGAARVSVAINGTALGQTLDQEVTGAGIYTITGSDLNVADGCGGTEPLPVLEFTATATGLTLWTVYQVTNPIMFDLPIELVFAIE